VNPTILFLDFDGVVADSMPAMTDAFVKAFEGHGFAPDAIIPLYHRFSGSGRDRIFDRVFEALAGRAMTQSEHARAQDIFARLEIRAAPGLALFPGVSEFLVREAARRALVLVTGTPAGAIDRILESLGITAHFAAVYSATHEYPKDRRIREELEFTNVSAANALFVGDSLVDMAGAKGANVAFVGVGNPEFFSGGSAIAIIDGLPDLAALLERGVDGEEG
jgi:HAD superfamily hydrolase (TIGR01549 family)